MFLVKIELRAFKMEKNNSELQYYFNDEYFQLFQTLFLSFLNAVHPRRMLQASWGCACALILVLLYIDHLPARCLGELDLEQVLPVPNTNNRTMVLVSQYVSVIVGHLTKTHCAFGNWTSDMGFSSFYSCTNSLRRRGAMGCVWLS